MIALRNVTAVLVAAGLASTGTAAGSGKDEALREGARQLAADEIAEQFVGRTGTWVSPSGDKKIMIYYGRNNDLRGEMVGGDWSGTGYYAVTNTDRICVSWDGADTGRLRCLDVLIEDGTVEKYNADGSLNGRYEGFEDGKAF